MSTAFFETAIFSPQIEFSGPSEAETPGKTPRVTTKPNRVRFLVYLKAVSFVAASLWLSREVIASSSVVLGSHAVMREATRTVTSGVPLDLAPGEVEALGKGRPLVRSAELREVARQATERLKKRQGESIDTWAQRIALDVANASD